MLWATDAYAWWTQDQGFRTGRFEMYVTRGTDTPGYLPHYVFVPTGKDGWWDTIEPYNRAKSIPHELTHVVQWWRYNEGRTDVPQGQKIVWFFEGQAEHFAFKWLAQGFEGGPQGGAEFLCDFSLSELEGYGSSCVFDEGRKALDLLEVMFGEKSMDVLPLLRRQGFDGAFESVYGISREEFYELFEQYRQNGYIYPFE